MDIFTIFDSYLILPFNFSVFPGNVSTTGAYLAGRGHSVAPAISQPDVSHNLISKDVYSGCWDILALRSTRSNFSRPSLSRVITTFARNRGVHPLGGLGARAFRNSLGRSHRLGVSRRRAYARARGRGWSRGPGPLCVIPVADVECDGGSDTAGFRTPRVWQATIAGVASRRVASCREREENDERHTFRILMIY